MENTQKLCKTMILSSIESQGVFNLSLSLIFPKLRNVEQNFMNFTDYYNQFFAIQK